MAAEPFASMRIAGALDAPEHDSLVKAIGAREVLAGGNMLPSPQPA